MLTGQEWLQAGFIRQGSFGARRPGLSPNGHFNPGGIQSEARPAGFASSSLPVLKAQDV